MERPIDLHRPPPPVVREDGSVGIPLTRGYMAVVDAADADLGGLKWFAKKAPATPVYAMRRAPAAGGQRGAEVRLHRVILERIIGRSLALSELGDHVNGDTLDCRRENLRPADTLQNAHNRARVALGSSRYKGVYWDDAHGRWRATITLSGRRRHLGRFHDEEQAARAYDAAAGALHREFARLNFPERAA